MPSSRRIGQTDALTVDLAPGYLLPTDPDRLDPAHRGRGLARALLEGVLEDLAPLRLKRVLLKASARGRGIDEQACWVPLGEQETWMERRTAPA